MRSEQAKALRSSRGAPKKRCSTLAPISLEDLMDKEVWSSSQDGDIRDLSVLSDPSDEQSTKIKQRICMLDHPKNLIKVLRDRHAIEKGLIGNAITTGPNQFCFTRTLLKGEALRIFNLKAIELGQETAANLKTVLNHVVSYFGPNECLSKQKRYLRYKMTKPRKLTTRQNVGLVRDLNSRMAHLPPLFDESQVLEESELVDFLANKAPKYHKAMLINQGFNPETSTLETFVEHCERAETTDDIAGTKFAASDEDSEPRRKKRTKTKNDHGKKRIKRSTKMYCSLHGDNTSHTSQSRELVYST